MSRIFGNQFSLQSIAIATEPANTGSVFWSCACGFPEFETLQSCDLRCPTVCGANRLLQEEMRQSALEDF
jgi:hypothetical protein